jgi:hypothetical protein
MSIDVTRRAIVLSLLGSAALLSPTLSGAALASERPLLTVSGKIGVTDANGGAAHFDRAALEAVGMVALETSTPWFKDPVRFEGVPLAKLMDTVGATGERIVAVALNDYSAELPMEDVRKYNPILALKRNGEYMSVRDKGPLFIVYPFDSHPDLKNQKYYSRSVWQIARLEVK